MKNDDLDRQTQIVLKNAHRAISEAKGLLSRTEKYFQDTNLSPEKLQKYLENLYAAKEEEIFSGLVERAIAEAREEVERNKNLAHANGTRSAESIFPKRKTFSKMV